MNPNSHDFQRELEKIFEMGEEKAESYVEIISGNLHRKVGGYPGRDHRMPICCQVMKRNMRKDDQILEQPSSGKGATLRIRYKLPR